MQSRQKQRNFRPNGDQTLHSIHTKYSTYQHKSIHHSHTPTHPTNTHIHTHPSRSSSFHHLDHTNQSISGVARLGIACPHPRRHKLPLHHFECQALFINYRFQTCRKNHPHPTPARLLSNKRTENKRFKPVTYFVWIVYERCGPNIQNGPT